MKSKKRLGKSLEDISHLFLSRPEPHDEKKGATGLVPGDNAKSEKAPVKRIKKAPGGKTRVWLSLSLVPGLPSAFFSGNLAVELARNGRQVLMVETAPVPSLDGIFGSVPIQPTLADLLEQTQKEISFEGPRGIRVLGFRLNPPELNNYSVDERDVLAQIFSREEEEAEMVIVHARYSENPLFDDLLRSAQGVVLAASPTEASITEVYRVCKYLFRANPGLRIGLMAYANGETNGKSSLWMGKLVAATRQFLGKVVEWYGTIPSEPLIERSLAAKVPVTLLDPSSKSAAGFSMVSDKMQGSGQAAVKKNGNGYGYSFFETLHQPGLSGKAQ